MPSHRLLLAAASVSTITFLLAACGSDSGSSGGPSTLDSLDAGGGPPPSGTGTSTPPPPAKDAGTAPPPAAQYTVGGTVAGLAGTGLVLQNNGGDDLAVAANGSFTFAKKVTSGGAFAVTVKTQPTNPSQTCTVSGGTGTVASGNVSSVTINCTTDKFTVGGTVSGLGGTGLVLQNNLGDDLTVNANGSFSFATPVASGAQYAVTVKTQPSTPAQTCTVTNGTGTVGAANVTSVGVACVRSALDGDYASFVTASTAAGAANTLVVGDKVAEPNNYGGFYFKLAANVAKVRIAFVAASGSKGGNNGGSGASGTVDLTPAFLTAQAQTGFWVILGQAGKASAGPTGPLDAYRAFNGGGAGTEWASCCGKKDTFMYVAGGGGASDLRFDFDGDKANPQTGNPALGLASRFAILGGGGGGTGNTNAYGGGGGTFGANGGNGNYATPGEGGTQTAGGNVGGVLGIGGDGKTDNTQGWSGGGGGGYYGGGSSPAHGGGGGGSGYLMTAAGLTQIAATSGANAGNATTTANGAFTITVE